MTDPSSTNQDQIVEISIDIHFNTENPGTGTIRTKVQAIGGGAAKICGVA